MVENLENRVEMSVESLTFRRATEEDLPAVFALWDIGGWGPVRPAWFRRRFLEGPLGPAFITVAEDPHGKLVASTTTDYKQALLGGEPGIVRRGHALVVAPEWRRSSRATGEYKASELIPTMGRWTVDALATDGASATYALPNPSLHGRPNVSGADTQYVDYKCLRIEMADLPELARDLDVVPVRSFHTEYDRLWERSRRGLGFRSAVVRDAKSLNHFRSGGTILECRLPKTAELVGYVAMGRNSLGDALAVDRDALVSCLRSAFMYVREAPDRVTSKWVTAIAHPWVDETLRDLGGFEVDWVWRMTVTPPNAIDRLKPEYAPADWWVTAGD